MDLLQYEVVAQIVDAVGTVCSSVYMNTPTCFLPFVPYWAFVLTLLTLSPLTMIIPQLLQGKLEWPRGCGNVWVIHGKRYDLTPFYDRHPGGSWILRTSKGSDCTALFESYHTFSDREAQLKMMAGFELPGKRASDREPELVKYEDFKCPFYDDIKQMARKHFQGKGKFAHKMATPNLLVASSLWVLMWVLIRQLVVYDQTWCIAPVSLLVWYLTGNVMHDSTHMALVPSPFLNRLFSYAPAPYCMNISAWFIQHVAAHHVYTNGQGDLDLYHLEPLKRFLPGGKGGKIKPGTLNYIPHCIVLILLSSTAIAHLSIIVPIGILCGHIDPAVGRKMYDECKALACHRAELFFPMAVEMLCQTAYFAWCYSHQGLVKGLCVNMSVYCLVSLLFSFFVFPSHFQPECFSPEFEKSWAKRQVRECVDFRPTSRFWGYASGGLNTQALHHVLPGVSAMHLREMYPKFGRICKKHGVEYKLKDSLSDFVMGFVDTAY